MTLGLRLALLLLAIFVLAGVVAVANGLRTADRYFESETQALGAPIAMYIVEHRSPFREGIFDADRFGDLARTAMILNPAIDIYALDAAGRVLAHGSEGRVLARGRIDLAPLRQFLGTERPERVLGDDPRHATRRRIFTAAAAGPPRNPWGYVYVVLDSDSRPDLTARTGPEQLRVFAGGALAAILVAGFAAAALLFVQMTKPLRTLAREMSAFTAEESDRVGIPRLREGDEVTHLRHGFKRLSARVTEQMLALRNVDTARREWIAHLSHDLRAPLAALHAHLEGALRHDGTATARERREALARGLLHCGQIRRMLEELFESARLEAPTLELRRETFELTELVQDATAGFRWAAEDGAVHVRCEAETPGAAMVHADIALFQRLIDNLLANAVKASRRGGFVTAIVRRSGSMVTLTVTDCGDGPTADMQAVLNEGREPLIGAAGLGLRILGRILRLHELRSWVETAPGGGSRVTIEIPAAAEVASAARRLQS
jgi:signal transduction histidine kinase